MKKKFIMRYFATILLCFFMLTQLYALEPEREYHTTPAEYGMNFNNLKIRTSDNLTLHAWLFNATERQSRKIVILSHNGEGNMANMIEIASNFLSLGYHVLTYDYRGFGSSDDFEINTRFFIYSQFQRDIEAVIDHVLRHYPSMRTIDLYGLGIGGGLSIGVGVNRPEINRVIADSPYLTFELTEKRYIENYDQKVMMPLGFDRTWIEPLYALDRKKIDLKGILLIAGGNDDMFIAADMRDLQKMHRKLISIYEVKGAKRNTTFLSDKRRYFVEIKNFIGD